MFKQSKIKSIKFIGKRLVYDLTIEDDHSYLADGFINHNSTPNVQNLPRKIPQIKLISGEIKPGMNIRGIFIAPKDYKLFSVDLSQAELRIMCEMAQDQVMQYYIDNNIDIHWKGALKVFLHDRDIPYDAKNGELKRLRKLVKLCNFGGLYGGSDQKKVQAVNEKLEFGEEKITMAIAQAHSEWFWSEFSRTQEYLKEMEEHILTFGWIDNKFGRRRRLPDAFSMKKNLRAEAVRQGINAQIQGCASDIAQCGYLKICDWFEENNMKSKALWTVHDEVDGIVHESELELVKNNLEKIMVEKTDKYLPLSIIQVKLESELEIFKERWGD